MGPALRQARSNEGERAALPCAVTCAVRALLLALLRALLLEDGLADRNGVGDSEAVTLEQLLSRSRSAVVV